MQKMKKHIWASFTRIVLIHKRMIIIFFITSLLDNEHSLINALALSSSPKGRWQWSALQFAQTHDKFARVSYFTTTIAADYYTHIALEFEKMQFRELLAIFCNPKICYPRQTFQKINLSFQILCSTYTCNQNRYLLHYFSNFSRLCLA